LTFDPLLRDIVAGVEVAVAPDIIIPIPKAAAAPAAVTTAMAVGNQTVVHAAAGPINFDILTIRWHTIQRVLALANQQKYAELLLATPIANGAGTAIDPLLRLLNVLQIPDICVPIPKTVPGAVTRQSFVGTVLATGPITIQTNEGAPVNHDVLFLENHTLARVIASLVGNSVDTRRFFTIIDNVSAARGAVYVDNAVQTRRFVINVAKVALDGSLVLSATQTAGTAVTAQAGQLNLLTGTGSATIAWTALQFEKYVDIQQNVAVPNAAGLVFDPGLRENGVAVRPDIVIPIPKAINIVPFVPTDLTTAPGTVNVQHNGGGPINHDILSIRIFSVFRDQ
jgi:hypothetical protein